MRVQIRRTMHPGCGMLLVMLLLGLGWLNASGRGPAATRAAPAWAGGGPAPPVPSALPTTTPTPPAACAPTWHLAPAAGFYGPLAAAGVDQVWLTSGGAQIAEWNGQTWQPVPAPPLPATDAIRAIAAGGPGSLWLSTGGPYSTPKIYHRDGQAWTLLSGAAAPAPGERPAPPAAASFAWESLAATGPDDVWAVGGGGSYPVSYLMAAHCSATGCGPAGTMPLPPNTQSSDLTGVAAANPGDVWAVGGVQDAILGPVHSLVEHWTGGTWHLVPITDVDGLQSVAAGGPDDVWVRNPQHLLHWNGQAWTEVATPAPVADLVAPGPGDAWAVGNVIQNWDGQSWQIVPRAGTDTLAVVAAAGPADIWAAGSGTVEHYGLGPLFADQPAADPFAPFVQRLACRALISGYTCGGPDEPCLPPPNLPYFRTGLSVTRGQLVKLVAGAAGWTLPPAGAAYTFADVPPGHPFAPYVEAAAAQGVISGYACGGPGEGCDPQGRPYFRPFAGITRGQIAKVLGLAAGYPPALPAVPTFADVPGADPFYGYVEAVAAHGIVSGYSCGGPGEPCDAQQRPYYRPTAATTRGQAAKIVANTLLGGAGAR